MLPVECRTVFITARLDLPVRILLIAAFFVAGCGAEPDAGSTTGGQGPTRGELLSYACQACHSLGPGEQHGVGPNLNGVFGRRAGSAPGFDYSEALSDAGLVWSPELLDQWLAEPAGFLPGTTMAFTGYQSAEDRAALIDYLIAATEP